MIRTKWLAAGALLLLLPGLSPADEAIHKGETRIDLLGAYIRHSGEAYHDIEIHARCLEAGCWGDMDDILYYDPDRRAAIDTGLDDYYVLDGQGRRHPRLTGAMDDRRVTVVLQVRVPATTRRIELGYVDERQSAAVLLQRKRKQEGAL